MTDMQSNWVEGITKQIGEGIERARRGKSDQWIADRTEAIGHSLSRTAVSEYRRGVRKTMPVSDWLVLAAALGVPPVALLFPGLPDGEVIVLPGAPPAVAFDAVRWVSGERQTVPSSLDILFAPEGGQELGYVEGKREYRSDISYTGNIGLDLRLENDPAPETQILAAAREIVSVYDEIEVKTNLTWNELPRMPEEVKRTYFESLKKELENLISKKEELDSRILELGGIIQKERIHEGE